MKHYDDIKNSLVKFPSYKIIDDNDSKDYKLLLKLFFSLFFEKQDDKKLAIKLNSIAKLLYKLISLYGVCDLNLDDKMKNEIVDKLFNKLPIIREYLYYDCEAIYQNDPATKSKEEVILASLGFYALFVYRIAHELYLLNVNILPKILTEYAHSKTGIDISAGATIGKYFSIDHGTGIVIGETTVIHDNVNIYQGVTLGALSTRGGKKLSGIKRHPTIMNNVTIYANATILGGNTIIGDNVVVKANAFITESVFKNDK